MSLFYYLSRLHRLGQGGQTLSEKGAGLRLTLELPRKWRKIEDTMTDSTDHTTTDATAMARHPALMPVAGAESAYIHAATSDNTRLAYQSDIQHFLKMGRALPTTAEQVEAYLNACAPNYNPRTLVRRITALRQWHQLRGHPDPTQSPVVKKTLRGICRLHGQPRTQATALRLKDLDRIVAHLKAMDSLQAVRNRALLLVGFFGAFRRSELVALTWEQINFVSDGMIITIPRSKTDQTGEGAPCVIPFGNATRCPVRALINWRQASACYQGAIFRRISRVGQVSPQSITPHHLNRILRQLAQAVGLSQLESYSSHSLRRGFATEAARLGAPLAAIQRHGRWQCTKTVLEYIEAGRQFADSAVNVLFEF